MGIAFGPCVLDSDRRELRVDGEVVAVQRQVFDVLAYLVANGDRVVPKEELLDEVWGSRFVSESALTTRIKEARRAVGDDGSRQSIIKTVHGVGYRIVADIRRQETADSDGRRQPESATAAPAGVEVAPPGMAVPRTVYARRSGASIAYQRFGDGPELVIVSGFTTNVELLWEHPTIAHTLRLLGSFARVTLFDKRGVGCSDRVASERIPGLDVRCDDLSAVMDHAGIERASLLGTSEGGSLAAFFAAAHPERVERLALHGTWANSPTAFANSVALVEEHWGKGYIYSALSPRLAETKDGRRFLSRYERQSATPGLAASIVEVLADIDITDILPAIRTPTTIVHSPTDEWVPFAQAEILAAHIVGSTLITLSHPDHYLFSCDPGELVPIIRDFVTGQAVIVEAEHQLAAVVQVDVDPGNGDPGNAEAGGTDREGDAGMSAVGACLEECRGQLVHQADGRLTAVFESPGRALGAATAAMASVAALGLSARMGVHCGEVQRTGGSVHGVALEIASSILDHTPAGQVWVSRTITDLVAGNDLRFDDQGEHTLVSLDRPWQLFALHLPKVEPA